MATKIWVNIASRNGLLPDSAKPLPEPMLTEHPRGFVAFTRAISKEILEISLNILYKFKKYLRFQPHLPLVNTLRTVLASMLYFYGVVFQTLPSTLVVSWVPRLSLTLRMTGTLWMVRMTLPVYKIYLTASLNALYYVKSVTIQRHFW